MSGWIAALPSDYRLIFKPDLAVTGGGCHLDVWLPRSVECNHSKTARPVALMFHGGGFWFGSTTFIPLNQVAYLISRGVVVVSAAYRFRPHATLDDIREDVLDAYKYLQNHLNDDLERCGENISVDGTRCCCLGWSAGGACCIYLAAGIASHNENAVEGARLPRLCGMVATYPLTDYDYLRSFSPFCGRNVLEQVLRENPVLATARSNVCKQKVSCEFIPHCYEIGLCMSQSQRCGGCDGDVPDQSRWTYQSLGLTIGGFASEICGEGPPDYRPGRSPNDLVHKDFPPTFIVVADDDTLLPPSRHSYTLFQRLSGMDVECEVAVSSGMGHGEAECFPWLKGAWDDKGERWWNEAIRPSLDWAIKKLF